MISIINGKSDCAEIVADNNWILAQFDNLGED